MNKLILRSCDVGLKNYDVLFSLQFDILFLQQQEQQDEQQQNHLSQLQFLWMVNIGYPKLFRFTAQHLVTWIMSPLWKEKLAAVEEVLRAALTSEQEMQNAGNDSLF